MSILRLHCSDSKSEFQKFKRKQIKESKRFIDLLSNIVQPIIISRHPRVANTIDAIENEKMRFNARERERDWVCAILDKAGVVNASSYSRMQNQDHNISLSQVISICIFFGLDLCRTDELLAATGYALRPGNQLHDHYAWLIEKSYEEASTAQRLKRGDLKYHSLMMECNQYLTLNGITNEQAMLGVKNKKTAL